MGTTSWSGYFAKKRVLEGEAMWWDKARQIQDEAEATGATTTEIKVLAGGDCKVLADFPNDYHVEVYNLRSWQAEMDWIKRMREDGLL